MLSVHFEGANRHRHARGVGHAKASVPDRGYSWLDRQFRQIPGFAAKEKSAAAQIEDRSARSQAAGRPLRHKLENPLHRIRSWTLFATAEDCCGCRECIAKNHRIGGKGLQRQLHEHPVLDVSMVCKKRCCCLGDLFPARARVVEVSDRYRRLRSWRHPHPRPLIAEICIRRIVYPAMPAPTKEVADILPMRTQQRTKQPVAAVKQHSIGHSRQTRSVHFGPTKGAHCNGFQLVVEGVACEDSICTHAIGSGAEECITRFPGSGGNSSSRLLAVPDERDVTNIEVRAKCSDTGSFPRGLIAKPVIHRCRDNGDIIWRLVTQGQQQPCGITPTGHSDQETARPADRLEERCGSLLDR